jgi:hypothetical protein
MAVNLTSGGIVFPATALDTDQANTFDDYEEGSYTPTHDFQNSTQESNKSFTVQEGLYVKVGQSCLVEAYISGGYSGGNQDNVNGSLPFTHTGLASAGSGGTSVVMTGNGQNFNGTLIYVNDNQAIYTYCSTFGVGNFSQSMPTSYNMYVVIPYRST